MEERSRVGLRRRRRQETEVLRLGYGGGSGGGRCGEGKRLSGEWEGGGD